MFGEMTVNGFLFLEMIHQDFWKKWNRRWPLSQLFFVLWSPLTSLSNSSQRQSSVTLPKTPNYETAKNFDPAWFSPVCLSRINRKYCPGCETENFTAASVPFRSSASNSQPFCSPITSHCSNPAFRCQFFEPRNRYSLLKSARRDDRLELLNENCELNLTFSERRTRIQWFSRSDS
jgi:hypothetical protein